MFLDWELVPPFVNITGSKFKLAHSQNQTGPLGVKAGTA